MARLTRSGRRTVRAWQGSKSHTAATIQSSSALSPALSDDMRRSLVARVWASSRETDASLAARQRRSASPWQGRPERRRPARRGAGMFGGGAGGTGATGAERRSSSSAEPLPTQGSSRAAGRRGRGSKVRHGARGWQGAVQRRGGGGTPASAAEGSESACSQNTCSWRRRRASVGVLYPANRQCLAAWRTWCSEVARRERQAAASEASCSSMVSQKAVVVRTSRCIDLSKLERGRRCCAARRRVSQVSRKAWCRASRRKGSSSKARSARRVAEELRSTFPVESAKSRCSWPPLEKSPRPVSASSAAWRASGRGWKVASVAGLEPPLSGGAWERVWARQEGEVRPHRSMWLQRRCHPSSPQERRRRSRVKVSR